MASLILLLMWANPAVEMTACVTVETQDLKSVWKVVFDNPSIELASNDFSMLVAVVVDMVNRQKDWLLFSTALAFVTVMRED